MGRTLDFTPGAGTASEGGGDGISEQEAQDLIDASIADLATEAAVTAAVGAAVDDLVGDAGAALDTLGELADALSDDENFAATMTAALATKAPLAATGVHLAYGDSAGDETTTSATAVPLTGLTWPSVPAAVDDILEIELTANFYVGAAGNIFVRFDLGGTDGREHMLDCASTRPGDHVVKEYRQVTSGMIVGGEVAITADWWRGSTSVSANMENDSTRTIPVLAVTNRGAPLV